MISIKIEGMQALQARLAGQQKQIAYAASRALNNVAFGVNAEIKNVMRNMFKGGATPYVQRAFRVEKATRQNLTATVALRDDAPEGGTSYAKMLRHLFTGGTREWKKVEGLLRGIKALPDGYMAVPGAACPLDRYGNIKRTQFAEMLGVLRSSIRNLRVDYTRGKQSKRSKRVGFFVIQPGAKSNLRPGIWRRIEQGSYSTVVQPYIMFVRRGNWKRSMDLQSIGERVIAKRWQSEFNRELATALANAR